MSLSDHGGSGLAIETTDDQLVSFIQLPQSASTTPYVSFTSELIDGIIGLNLFLTSVHTEALGDGTVAIRFSFTFSSNQGIGLQTPAGFFVVAALMGGEKRYAATRPPFGVTVQCSVSLKLRIQGTATIVVDFPATAAGLNQNLYYNLDRSRLDSVFNHPLIFEALVEKRLEDPSGMASEAYKHSVRSVLDREIAAYVIGRLTKLGTVVVVPPPSLSFAIPANSINEVVLRRTPSSLHLLYTTVTTSGPLMGNPAVVSSARLLKQDRAVVTFNNVTLLEGVLRPAVTAALGLVGSTIGVAPFPNPFVAGHPFFWSSGRTLRLAIPPSTSSLLIKAISRFDVTRVVAGTDGFGIRLLVRVVATSVADAFRVNIDIDQRFSVGPTVTGNTLALVITPSGPPAIGSTIVVSPIGYILAVIWGGPLGAAIAAIVGGVGASDFNGPVAAAFRALLPTATATLRLPFSATSISAVSFSQPDSITRTISFGGFGSAPDIFPAHDFIVNLA